MPLYEFVCDDCDRGFEELFRSMTERRRITCPQCKGRNVHKVFSTFSTAGGDASKGSGGGCATCTSGSCATCGH